jgi:deazaflavin-dependent oxidoreductase (nitroreductase family)
VHTAPMATRLPATVAADASRGLSQAIASVARASVLRFVAPAHAFLYRRTAGRLGGSVCGRPVLVLSTRGRKSGRRRAVPLCFLAAGRDLVVAAAAAGHRGHPAWYLNLLADPRVDVQLGGVRRPMIARVAVGFERARLWERICSRYAVCADYERRARRTIPVVVLAPEDEGRTS